jgi:poly-gamma-glutamate capsule biosynthesis protein CapA/YwtB (metallophosphatase superfamily)
LHKQLLIAVLVTATVAPAAAAAAAERRPITLVWGGDVTLGSDYGRPPQRGWPQLAGIADLLRRPDVAAVNYEGTLGRRGPSKCAGGRRNCFAFNAPASHAGTLRRAGVDIVNQANNHAFDFGATGFRATRAALASAHVRFTGAPGQVEVLRRHRTRIAFAGFSIYPWSASMRDPAPLVRRAARRADIVVAFVHAGAEGAGKVHVPLGHEHAFGEDRGDSRRFAHAAIDAGADLVVGSGPHVVRGAEIYRDRLIAYSLGNLTGWKNFSTAGASGLSALLSVTLDPDGRLLGGHVTSLALDRVGVPHIDPRPRAEALMRRVSASDFGARSAWLAEQAVLDQGVTASGS